MNQLCPYDVQMWSWRRVRETVLQPREEEDDIDISDGNLFPWWLLLGGTGKHRPLIDRGVTRVVLSGRAVWVTLLDGEVSLYSSRHKRMEIHEATAA